jgi:hypothetical protein
MKKFKVMRCTSCIRKDGTGTFFVLKLQEVVTAAADAFGQLPRGKSYYYAVANAAAVGFEAELNLAHYHIQPRTFTGKEGKDITVDYLYYKG